jgi:dynein intermediate chain 1
MRCPQSQILITITLQGKTLLKPSDQLQLTEKELDEEFTRILNANNPHAAQNFARFNNKERTYKAVPNIDHLIVHFEFEGFVRCCGRVLM